MNNIRPQHFKDAFLKAVSDAGTEVLSRFDGAAKEFTLFMRQKVLSATATHLKLNSYHSDYFCLDSIYYTEKHTDGIRNHSFLAHCINVAIEHERDITSTNIEMIKLQMFNTPLKVLITYAHRPSDKEKYLNRYTHILRAADIFGDFTTHRRQLVIFGSRLDMSVSWHFYAYEDSGFTVMA